MIEEVKKYLETVEDEETHSKLIYHLFTICEMSVEDISECYDECTPETIVKHLFEVYNIALKKCTQKGCLSSGKYQPIDNFYKDWGGAFGVASKCKKCILERSSKRYKIDPEVRQKRRQYNTRYYEENSEYLIQQSINYINQDEEHKRHKLEHDRRYNKNRYDNDVEYRNYKQEYEKIRRSSEEFKEYQRNYMREYQNNKYHTDIKFRLKTIFSSRLNKNLINGKQFLHFEEIVDYTIDKLIATLESKFEENMTWNNYGANWWIDHLVPESLFEYASHTDPEFKMCWSLENLQPMWKEKNIEKSDMLLEEYKNIDLAINFFGEERVKLIIKNQN